MLYGLFMTIKLAFFFYPLSLSLARSHFIDSPPTYNADYGYKSWEAYSNLSYYTRTLPPVPEDCPTPMGVVGECSFAGCWENQFSQILRYLVRVSWPRFFTRKAPDPLCWTKGAEMMGRC